MKLRTTGGKGTSALGFSVRNLFDCDLVGSSVFLFFFSPLESAILRRYWRVTEDPCNLDVVITNEPRSRSFVDVRNVEDKSTKRRGSAWTRLETEGHPIQRGYSTKKHCFERIWRLCLLVAKITFAKHFRARPSSLSFKDRRRYRGD